MGSWQPQQQALRELLILLQEAARPDNREQALMQQRLASFNEIPDYNSYLVYILTRMRQEDAYTRAIAGLTLKNNVKAFFNSIQLSVLDYIKACCVEALEHPDPDVSVRKTVGSVIAAIVTGGQAHNWPEILQVLVNNLDSSDPFTVELAMDTLRKVCEDAARDLDQEMEGVRPLNYMIPKLISFFHNPDPKLRIQAIAATSQFVMLGTQALLVNMETYLAGLFACAFDKNTEVRQEVARSLVMVLEGCPDKLEPSLPSVFDYMIQCTKDDDEAVALEACDFWIQFCNVQTISKRLIPYLDRVVPALLDRMVYSETDLLMMGGADMDTNVPDNEQDIHPRCYKGKTRFGGSNGREAAKDGDDKLPDGGEPDYDDEDDDDVLDDDEEDLDDEEFFSEWTLRKCSAAALDELSNTFKGHVVSALLPLLPNKMFSQDWKVRESGVLALGAAAEGGMDDFSMHLPEIMPHLLSSLNDNQPLIRSITCWALGRFSRWCVDQAASPEGRAAFFEPVLFSLLQRVLDKNKRVQEAACSAFATLEEEATVELIPYLEPILINLTTAFNMYQHKNLLILYDALGTLAESVGSTLNQPRCLQLMMPPLITKWNELSDQDKDLFPLLECLSSVTAALGTGFAPFAEPVFTRCVKLVEYTLQQIFLADQNPEEHDPPDVEFMVVALDLLSGLVQGLDNLVEPLIAKSEPPLLSLVAVCVHDPVTEVLQATYALVGDIAIACFEQLRGYLGPILPELIEQINANAHLVSVSNNAIWAAGEIALRWGSDMQPYVDALLQRLIPLLLDPSIQPYLQENAMVTIGRLGYACPDRVAVHLQHFLKSWLNKSLTMRENDEKDTAFQGLCEMIKKNPHGVANDFTLLLETIAQWQKPSAPLLKCFAEILSGYRNLLTPEQWQQTWNTLSADAQQALSRRYAL